MKSKNEDDDERIERGKLLKTMVERTGGASTVPCSGLLVSSFHAVQEGEKVVVLLFLLLMSRVYVLAEMPCYFLPHLLGLRITVQSLHSFKGPPVTKVAGSLWFAMCICCVSASPCFGFCSL